MDLRRLFNPTYGYGDIELYNGFVMVYVDLPSQEADLRKSLMMTKTRFEGLKNYSQAILNYFTVTGSQYIFPNWLVRSLFDDV